MGVFLSLSATMVQAVATSSFSTSFSSTESLWQGAGIPATGFNESFSTGGAIGINGRAFANTGTATAAVNGSLAATYDEKIKVGSSTNVALNFIGSGSTVASAFGAEAAIGAFVNACVVPNIFTGGCITRVNESFDLAGVGASLQPERAFNANIGANSGNASDQQEVTSVGALDLGIIGRLGASVDLDFRQTISLTPTTMDGILQGVNRGNGNVITQAFAIGASDMANLSFAGLGTGIWDFSILDLDLFGRFYNTASLVLEPTINYIIDSTVIASLTVPLITNSFLMDFNTLGSRNLFSVIVTPIPAAVWLFGTALLGFVGFARRRVVA